MQFDPAIRYSFIAALAGLIAFVATPVTLMVARRLGFTDAPRPYNLHLAPIPVLGGVAIWAAFVGGLILLGGGEAFRELTAIVVGGTLIALVGLVDDRVGLGPRGKFSGQVIAALVLVLGGVQAELFVNHWLNVALTIFWVVGITNAINLLDNMDGLAAGVSAAAAVCFLLLAALNGQILVASLAAALLGACLGFLFYNFQPAISFMGDTGSMLLGFALAVLAIKLTFPGIPREQTWMVPVLVLGVPIFDTVLVVISRCRRGVPWWRGGVDHASHRLVQLGLSHRRVVIALYVVTIALGLVSVLIVHLTTRLVSWLAMGGVTLLGLLLLYVLEELWSNTHDSQLKSDMRVTVIGGGTEFLPVLDAAVALGRRVAVVLTPANPVSGVKAAQAHWREIGLDIFVEFVVCLAEYPGSIRPLLSEGAGIGDRNLLERATLMNSAFRLRGQLLVNWPPPPGSELPATASDEVLIAFQNTDLIVIGGDLAENVMPTLSLPEVSRALQRSKRPRVLVHSKPEMALSVLHAAGVGDVITHAIAPEHVHGPWYPVADVRNSGQVAQALRTIWLERTRVIGLPRPLAGALHG